MYEMDCSLLSDDDDDDDDTIINNSNRTTGNDSMSSDDKDTESNQEDRSTTSAARGDRVENPTNTGVVGHRDPLILFLDGPHKTSSNSSLLEAPGHDKAWIWIVGAFLLLQGGASVLVLQMLASRIETRLDDRSTARTHRLQGYLETMEERANARTESLAASWEKLLQSERHTTQSTITQYETKLEDLVTAVDGLEWQVKKMEASITAVRWETTLASEWNKTHSTLTDMDRRFHERQTTTDDIVQKLERLLSRMTETNSTYQSCRKTLNETAGT